MDRTATMTNAELADLYCALCAEHFRRVRLARSSDLRFANDLERDIKHVQGLIAARGLLDKQHDDQLAD